MRFATFVQDGRPSVAVVRDRRVFPLAVPDGAFGSLRDIAASGADGLRHIREWAHGQPERASRSIDDVEMGPAVPDPGAIYTIGLNYRDPHERDAEGPQRPMIYGKAANSVTGHGCVVTWDRSLAPNVDAECELGVVIGAVASAVATGDAMRHVFGYTCINDISSRDPWLDGDQWLIGKSMPGFCPVGPWVVTRDELEPGGLRLGCTLNGIAVQDDTTGSMRFSVAEVVSYLSRHITLRPGDLIATGTPVRLDGPIGPGRHLQPGDTVTVWIEGIGDLTTKIA